MGITRDNLGTQLTTVSVKTFDADGQTVDTGGPAQYHVALYGAGERPRHAHPLTGGGAGDMQ